MWNLTIKGKSRHFRAQNQEPYSVFDAKSSWEYQWRLN